MGIMAVCDGQQRCTWGVLPETFRGFYLHETGPTWAVSYAVLSMQNCVREHENRARFGNMSSVADDVSSSPSEVWIGVGELLPHIYL
jgi:hypothetical protein